MQALEQEIKELIIDALELEDLTPADIDSTAPLFGEGLGLDSIDALELGVSLQKRYGIKLSANSEETAGTSPRSRHWRAGGQPPGIAPRRTTIITTNGQPRTDRNHTEITIEAHIMNTLPSMNKDDIYVDRRYAA
jgi:acyl carrier protein